MARVGESFEHLERDKLRPLPNTRFEYADWIKVRPNIDYHVVVDWHFYSVPHSLRHEQLERG